MANPDWSDPNFTPARADDYDATNGGASPKRTFRKPKPKKRASYGGAVAGGKFTSAMQIKGGTN